MTWADIALFEATNAALEAYGISKIRPYVKLKEFHEGVKNKVRELEQNIANVLSEVQTKVEGIEKKFSEAHDVSGMVATEVHKHHSVFSLLGSEVECMRTQRHTNEKDIATMKDAIERIVDDDATRD